VPITQNPGQWLGRMILPWIAIAAAQAGVTAKLTQAVVLDVVGEDYIRTAYAKGLDSQRVFWVNLIAGICQAALDPRAHVTLGCA
jgi:peptide/nickel transport system permease protein